MAMSIQFGSANSAQRVLCTLNDMLIYIRPEQVMEFHSFLKNLQEDPSAIKDLMELCEETMIIYQDKGQV